MKVLSFFGGIVGFVAANLLGILPHTAQVAVTIISSALTALGVRGAKPQDSISQVLDKMGKGWKTATGAIMAALGYLLDPSVLGSIPPNLAKGLQIVGVVLAALGLYHAQGSK